MKKNNLLKTVLLFVFSVFLLQSCRTDIENNGQKTVSEQPYSKLITLDNLNIELSSNTTFQKSKVSSIIQEKTLSNENFKLAEDNYSKDFITSIDTKNIVKVEKSNGLTTYTLNVKTKDNSKERHFYQLILIAQNNNFDYRLIKYIPSDDFNVSNMKTENFKGEIIAYNIDGLPNDGSIKMGRMGIDNSIQNCATIAYIEKVWAKCSIHGYYSPKPEYGCEGGHWEYDLVISTSCDGGGSDVPPPSGWDYGSPSAGDTGGGLGGGSGSYNGGIPTDPTYILAADLIINVIPDLSLSAQNFLYTHPDIADVLAQQLVGSPVAQDKIDFVSWATNFFVQNPNTTKEQFQYIMQNKTVYESNLGDDDNNTIGGYDNTTYSTFNPLQQQWTTIQNVLTKSEFIGWGYPGIKRNCMDYAKAQIGIKGYQISNYSATGQTIQVYSSQNGVNKNNVIAGLSYLKYALSKGIPVIVGVDDAPGNPGNADQTTDHFIVIVGMDSDSKGNYFSFFDNASGDANLGASLNNKLYYDSVTGLIKGTSDTPYASGLTYILTQIRKSKLK